ncbi:hypothetical protein SAMN05216366_1274 [Selenomonas ruminantium]|uniref:DUF6418 domain-containing protein n=1 Tax=Selenomonas ruminantium TaxID=971 RepID=A0A1H0TYQ8_SELRU|nr:hypothetical protein SAMN05216366_1274 [Selenomonas ruminantium]
MKIVFDDFCLLCFKCIFFLFLFNAICQLYEPLTNICNVLAVFVWLVIIYNTKNVDKSFCALLFPLSWLYSYAIFSELYFELYPSFTPELMKTTYATGGLVRLILYNSILFIGADIAFKKVKMPIEVISKANRYGIYLLYFVIVSLLITSFVTYGIPLLEGVNRFVFWNKEVENPLFSAARGNTFIVFLLLMLLFNERSKKMIWMVVVLVILTALGGDKFSPFMVFILYALIVIVIRENIKFDKKFCMKAVGGVLLIFFLLLQLIYYHYAEIAKAVNVNDAIVARLVEQGQVWWMVDQIMLCDNAGLIGNAGIIDEIKAGFSLTTDPYYYGMYKIMRMIISQDMVLRYYEFGVEFTEGYPAIGLIYFGYFGLVVFQLFIGYLYGKCAICFYKSVRMGDALGCAMIGKLHSLFIVGLVGGNLWKLFSYKAVLLVTIYYLWCKFRRSLRF